MARRLRLDTLPVADAPDFIYMSPANWRQALYEAKMQPHREEMARRKGERAARVFGFRPSVKGEPIGPIVMRMLRKRTRDLIRGAVLRGIRAREVNFYGDAQR